MHQRCSQRRHNATTCPGGQTLDLGNIGVQQWQSNLYTRTFIDDNKNGIWEPNEIGIPLIYTMIHYRDGHNANALTTDFNGVAPFNETFPLFNWYVVEADSTRYKTTGIHTVYDAGGPADGTTSCGPGNGARPCGTSTAYNFMSNTFESVPLPADLSVPGAVYCTTADCTAEAASFAAGTAIPSSVNRFHRPHRSALGLGGGLGGLNRPQQLDRYRQSAVCSLSAGLRDRHRYPCGRNHASTTQVGENGGIYGTSTMPRRVPLMMRRK